jgi:type IV pilus assembly protein PilA
MNGLQRKIEAGFTLIELMIVVAIVGILASIAMPAYQDYMARSQSTEAVNLAAQVLPTIQEIFTNEGTLANADDGVQGVPAAGVVTGRHVASQVVTNGGAVSTFRAAPAANGLIAGSTLTFTPQVSANGDMIYRCAAAGAVAALPTGYSAPTGGAAFAAGTANAQAVPKSCR